MAAAGLISVLNVKAVVAAFNQEKVLVVIVQLHRLIVNSSLCARLVAAVFTVLAREVLGYELQVTAQQQPPGHQLHGEDAAFHALSSCSNAL